MIIYTKLIAIFKRPRHKFAFNTIYTYETSKFKCSINRGNTKNMKRELYNL